MMEEKLKKFLPNLIGGSADLSGSNNTKTSLSKIINSKVLKVIIFIMELGIWYGCCNEWTCYMTI